MSNYDIDLIKALKKNDKPFGLMPEAMQVKVEEIGLVGNFLFLTPNKINGKAEWALSALKQEKIHMDDTYRLRPDYKEKPEILEYDVCCNEESGYLYFIYEQETPLGQAVDIPDFIGFKYEDGYVCTESRRYLDSRETTSVLAALEELTRGDLKVLTPTHVLFQELK